MNLEKRAVLAAKDEKLKNELIGEYRPVQVKRSNGQLPTATMNL